MRRSDINWSPEPPDESWVPIVSVKRQQTLRVIAAGPVRGVKTHWIDGRSMPCVCKGPRDGLCKSQLARWKGYLPAVYPNGRKVIVEVTLGAVRSVPELLRRELVGLWVKFTRPGDRNNAAVYCELLLELQKAINVVPYDPTPSLFAMWEMPPDEREEEAPPDPEWQPL